MQAKAEGKVHRYVEIKSEKDIHHRALKQLIEEGMEAWKKRKGLKASR